MSSVAKRPDGQWRARYRDDDGHERARHFARKVDAQRWLDEVTATLVGGTYVDPTLGRQTCQAYAEAWRGTQPHRPTPSMRNTRATDSPDRKSSATPPEKQA